MLAGVLFARRAGVPIEGRLTLMGAAAPSTLAVLALASLIFFAPRHMTVGQLLLEPPAHLLPAIYRISYMGAGLAVAGTLAMALNFSPFLYFRF